MSLEHKHVAIIGAGVAGLTAADQLARQGVHVALLEKTPFLGGHAIQLNCKATERCVKCGACLGEEKLLRAGRHAHVNFYVGTQVERVLSGDRFELFYRSHSPLINAEQCNGCGICFQKCPVPGALLQGKAPREGTYIAIRRELCRFFDDAACTLCRDACPRGAIELSFQARSGSLHTDAIVLATGFSPYNPSDKPYGYGRFSNVITSLDAERLMREHTVMVRPSDGELARRIAFVQCVGSRDTQLGHPWCSKICCGSSLRMTNLIQARQADAGVSFFYIDVQTFGKNFQTFYDQDFKKIETIRAIPGDVTASDNHQLQVVYFDPERRESAEALFDVVVLSIGLMPSADNVRLAGVLNWGTNLDGFLLPRNENSAKGIYTIGSAQGPMTIAESISSATQTSWEIVQFLEGIP